MFILLIPHIFTQFFPFPPVKNPDYSADFGRNREAAKNIGGWVILGKPVKEFSAAWWSAYTEPGIQGYLRLLTQPDICQKWP